MRTLLGIATSANAALFFFGAIQHAGMALGPFHEPLIVPAAIVETICGLALATGAAAIFRRSAAEWRLAFAANLVALAGVSAGMVALAVGAGPRTASNDFSHRIILGLIGIGLVLLFLRGFHRQRSFETLKGMKSLTGIAILLAVVPGWAGVRIQMEVTDVKAGTIVKQEMLLDAERLRVNTTAEGSPASIFFLTDGGRSRIVILNPARNEYRELDQQTMDQLSGIMSQMQAQLQNLPPEQRDRIEQMMRGRMGQAGAGGPAGTTAQRTTYTAKGSGSVNGFACTKYEGMRGADKVAELCAAKPADLHFNPSDFQVFDKMREFISSFASAIANSPFANGRMDYFTQAGFEGYPVQHTTFSAGEAASKMEVKSIERASFSDADFSLGNAKKMQLMPGPK